MSRATITFVYILLFSFHAFAQKKPINEQKFVAIGGIEQWVTIKGEDTSKPVVLFLHGGPGSNEPL